MIGRIVWFAALLALAVVTAVLQLDRQSAMSPALAPLVPQAMRGYAQAQIAAAAAQGSDAGLALEEARRLVRRRPIPAENLTVLAVAQTKAGQVQQAGLTIQIAGQRGWRDPVAQEAVLRLALAAGDQAEAARRYAALLLRRETPDSLLSELAPQVLGEAGGPGQTTLVDIIIGTDRWDNAFLRRGAQVVPPAAFSEVAVASIGKGKFFDCTVLAQTIKGLGQRDAAASNRLLAAAAPRCRELPLPNPLPEPAAL